MKPHLFLFITVIILFFAAAEGCSSSKPSAEQRLKFINKSELKNQTSLYNYRFNFENDAWMNITAYVKKESANYIISINEPSENNLNVCTYSHEKDQQNFIITNRVRSETVFSLEEAIVKAIMFYLADNI